MSGYDLNKIFQRSVNYFWSTDQSQIYRTLKRLQQDDYVTQERIVQEDYPDKKVYTVTDAGRSELIRWIKTPMNDLDQPIREGWLGQLYFGDKVPSEDIVILLQAYREESVKLIEALEDVTSMIQHLPAQQQATSRFTLRSMTLEYGIFINRAIIEWIDNAIERVRHMTSRTDETLD